MVDYKAAYDEWMNKTQWVQDSIKPKELGVHRADVLRARILELEGKPKESIVNLETGVDTFEEYCKSIGLEAPTDNLYHKAFKVWVRGMSEKSIIKTGREMAHNVSGNGFLFRDEEQFVRFARELVARALGCECD